ncbi:MAG: hypothetical protein JHD16_03885 [Solirubrobacteraceae bacterium]|nr:hypothetical protein [Solirubrobacteraceae bacterium]
MPPRILIFVALSGDGSRAAAGAACERATAGTARPLSLAASAAPAAVLRAGDVLAADLDLRPIAGELALLAHVTALMRERPDALLAIDSTDPARLVALMSAADLARARLDAARPPAGTSTLAAQRAGAAPHLTALQAAAAAGDLLRAPELTSVGLLAGPSPAEGAEARAREALAFAGLTVATGLLPPTPAAAAQALEGAGGVAALALDPAPFSVATPGGAEVHLPLPTVPDDLRAVRSGQELALHAGGATRRLRAPASLGALVPGAVSAGDDGAVVVRFVSPGSAGTSDA